MIRVESYLLIDKQFVPVESFTGRVPDPHYIEGAIELEVNGKQILTLELFDYVDQLWSYIAQGLVEITEQESWSTYFPDQPIKLTFSTDKRRQRVKIDLFIPQSQIVGSPPARARTASAEFNEFMAAMCDAGQRFFRKMIEVVPENRTIDEKQLSRLKAALLTLSH